MSNLLKKYYRIVLAAFLIFSLFSCREKNTIVNPEPDTNLNYSFSKIYISSPAEYELWRQSNSYTIVWSPKTDNDFINIELYKKGKLIHYITNSTLNDGIFEWTIPDDIPNSNMYYIKVTKISNPKFYYISDIFSIRNF